MSRQASCTVAFFGIEKGPLVADRKTISSEGTEIWITAEASYNERVARVENQIISRLRDRLGSARNANEMFRVFSKFNALFVRPKIRGKSLCRQAFSSFG